MLKMRELLCNKRCKLLCYGCAAHYLNKVEEKATAEKIIDKAVAVHKHMRNVHIAHGMLSELGGRHPQLPNDIAGTVKLPVWRHMFTIIIYMSLLPRS